MALLDLFEEKTNSERCSDRMVHSWNWQRRKTFWVALLSATGSHLPLSR